MIKKLFRKIIEIFTVFSLVVLAGLLLAGCAKTVSETRDLFAMDTYMTLTAYGEHAKEALDRAEEEILFLDSLLSTGNPDSEISRLNSSGQGAVSNVSMFLLERSMEVHKMTDGAFNPLIYPIMKAWGFADRQYHVPEEQTLKQMLSLLDIDEISIDAGAREIIFGIPGMMIDFGGIAKGYTSSRVMELFREAGVESGLVSLGGNVQVLGHKPDGSAYKVAVRDPEDDSAFLGVLEVSDKAVITSGGYERFFEEDGVTYHHILDPYTGYPADQGLLSVTIVSDDGTLADALSTALYVLGVEDGLEVWQEHRDLFDVIFLTEDHELIISEGIQKVFTSPEYPVTVIN